MYELWHVVGEQPLFLLKKEETFDKIYEEFKLTSITKPCVIVFSERKTDIGIGGSEVFIYESPDNGKTVYKRKFGSYECKVLINIGDLN
tara:strand:- start:9504 stop:9770 length:267 start_codon:yes stop_codon:yes gene_type:complete